MMSTIEVGAMASLGHLQGRVWLKVDVSDYQMVPDDARRLAAQLLHAADAAEQMAIANGNDIQWAGNDTEDDDECNAGAELGEPDHDIDAEATE